MAAIDLIAEEPIRMSTKRVVACDGGKIYMTDSTRRRIKFV